MSEVIMNRCTKCICTTLTPHVEIDNDGICSECKNDTGFESFDKNAYKLEMEKQFDQIRDKNIPYHAMCMLSGGKDSTYILYMLKEVYKLRTLAFTVMNPFVNQKSKDNVAKIAKRLEVDLIIFQVDDAIMKKLFRTYIQNHEKYNLGEHFGCHICSRIYFRVARKMAIMMNIPFILDGDDPTQNQSPVLVDGKLFKENRLSGNAYDDIDKFFDDALGQEYRNSIYSPEFDLYKNNDFPTRISPFTFIDYDYEKNVKELVEKGIIEKHDIKSNITICSALHFFTYFSYKWFDSHSYIKSISRGIRRNISTELDQYSTDLSHTFYSREKHIDILEDVKKALFFVANHPDASEEDMKKYLKEIPHYLEMLGEEQGIVTLKEMSQMHYYKEYFDVNLNV